jgi:hypothetical protein
MRKHPKGGAAPLNGDGNNALPLRFASVIITSNG